MHVRESEAANLIDPLAPTIFHQPWWLSAATSGRYQQVEVSDGNRIIGRFPFSINRLPGRSISNMPTLTPRLGPAVFEGEGSENTRFLQRFRITKELIRKLPNVHRFRQRLHRGHSDALTFQSAGFRTGVQFTIEIDPQPEAFAWHNLRNKTRNVIRRAQEELEIYESSACDEFLHFYDQNMEARGKPILQSRKQHLAVCAAALERNAGKILCARNKNHQLASAIFLAFDTQTAYYLMSTRSLDSPNGATSLLVWEGIRFCMNHSLVFNFDIIGSDSLILFYGGFGGQTRPVYVVSKESKRVKLVDFCRQVTTFFPKESLFEQC
jgi:hypothetical protein